MMIVPAGVKVHLPLDLHRHAEGRMGAGAGSGHTGEGRLLWSSVRLPGKRARGFRRSHFFALAGLSLVSLIAEELDVKR